MAWVTEYVPILLVDLLPASLLAMMVLSPPWTPTVPRKTTPAASPDSLEVWLTIALVLRKQRIRDSCSYSWLTRRRLEKERMQFNVPGDTGWNPDLVCVQAVHYKAGT